MQQFCILTLAAVCVPLKSAGTQTAANDHDATEVFTEDKTMLSCWTVKYSTNNRLRQSGALSNYQMYVQIFVLGHYS